MRHPSLHEFISDEQEANLRKLAAYLLTLPADYPDFEMSDFTADKSTPATVSCGTAACAVGHGPFAGVAPLGTETDWSAYSYRAFISRSTAQSWQVRVPAGNAWDWCFGGYWGETDNTVHGAAKRILWMLDRGVPDDCSQQEMGDADLCYTDMVLA